MVVEGQHCPVEVPQSGVAGHPHPAHWPTFIAGIGEPAHLVDGVMMVLARKIQDGAGLSHTRRSLDTDDAFGLIAILLVALDDGGDICLQFQQLRGLDRAKVGMPDAALPVVFQPLPMIKVIELTHGQRAGLLAWWAFHNGPKSLLS